MVAESTSVLVWRNELAALQERLGRLFGRPEPRRQVGLYLEGLLSAAERKNGWQLAEEIGDARPWRTQRVLSHVLWDADAAQELCRDYVFEHLGAADGVLIVDETGFLKKGEHSVGVARQYSGTAGRIENVQIGVFLAYASSKGHALIDRELYLPQSWTTDPQRLAEAGVPDDIDFATKPALATGMLTRAQIRVVAVDLVAGNDPNLRAECEAQQIGYVLAIGCDRRVPTPAGPIRADTLVAGLPQWAWQQLSAGPGAKGERYYD